MSPREPLLTVEGLVTEFRSRGGAGIVRAVDGVGFTLDPGETLGVVGESGCGKSTLARSVLRLVEPAAGSIVFEGVDIRRLDARAMRAKRREMQIVFQDPYASLDPRLRVADIVGEPLAIHRIGDRASRRRAVEELLDIVGLPPSAADQYPHEFSGGQRQRIGIARAIALRPKLVVADEPVSALDVSIQAQVLNLLVSLRERFGLSYIFISHDLSVVEHMSDTVTVMYLGRIVETAPAEALFERPAHPYTQALIQAVPTVESRRRRRTVLAGELPNPERPPPGCPFHPRCPQAMDHCRTVVPDERDIGEGGARHLVRCHLYAEARAA